MSKITCEHCDHKPFRTERGLSWHLENIHGIRVEDEPAGSHQESPEDLALRSQLLEYGVENLHYMTHIANCRSILHRGILSHRLAEEIRHVDLASSSVQSKRDDIAIMGRGRTVHDYVPLYFATHTPMQRVLTQPTRASAPAIDQDDLVIIDVDAFRAMRIPGMLYTDGNAASDDTTFHQPPVDLSVSIGNCR